MKKVYVIAMMAVALGGVARADDVTKMPAWYDTITIKGDVRYRYERIDDKSKNPAIEERERFRARVGLYAKPNEDVDVGVRLTTAGFENGQGTAVSGNATETGYGGKKPAWFDAAYIDYHPSEVKGLDLIAGKMDIPYYRVADNVIDNDYTPEGLAAKYKAGDAEGMQFMANAAYHWLSESATKTDGKQMGAQALLKYGKDNYALVGAGYYATTSLQGHPVLDNTGANRSFGNETKKVVSGGTTSIVYACDFKVVEGFAEAGTTAIGDIPAKVYASYTVNTDADNDDTGYIAGVQYGAVKGPGSWEVGYNYRDLEKNAVLGAIVEDDAGGGGTNYKGHKITAGVGLMKNLQFNVWYAFDQKDPDGKNTDYNRLFLDLLAKF